MTVSREQLAEEPSPSRELKNRTPHMSSRRISWVRPRPKLNPSFKLDLIKPCTTFTNITISYTHLYKRFGSIIIITRDTEAQRLTVKGFENSIPVPLCPSEFYSVPLRTTQVFVYSVAGLGTGLRSCGSGNALHNATF